VWCAWLTCTYHCPGAVLVCLMQLARDADPMSMIRLAKMYLNGQGCQRNIALAQEWVRKAR
jgi:TPR repeat protein